MDKLDAEERKKMFDLMKDRELGGNMDWMYRGDKPDTEEFLLGKSVDKMVAEATTVEEGTGSIISERIKANVALDMQAKMREDPLFAIRKKEEDARRRLLENPVKMKQLEKLVQQQQLQKQKASKKAKKERKSKKKKNKSKESSSDSDSSGSENDLVNQYLTILTNKKKSGGAVAAGDASSQQRKQYSDAAKAGDSRKSDSRSRRDKHHQHRGDRGQNRQKGYHHDRDEEYSQKRTMANERAGRQRSQSPPEKRQRKKNDASEESEPEPQAQRGLRQDSSSEEGEISKRVYGLIKSVRHGMASAEPSAEDRMKLNPIKKSKSSSPSRSHSRSPNQSSHRKEPRRHYSPSRHHRSHKRRSPSASRSPSPVRKTTSTVPKRQRSLSKSPPRKKRSRTPPKKKLTAEEKQKKLQEMMEDAKWRDEQRWENVQRYKHEDQKERSRLSTYKGDPTFLSSMMSEHAAASSVEDRIKRNKHNIQRTRAALDKNFTQH